MVMSKPILSPDELSKLPAPRLIDARAGEQARERYRERHLEGAIWVDLEHDLAMPTGDPAHGGRHPLPDIHVWAQTLARLGITPQTHVVVYDDQSGANAAARCWWMLKAVGHAQVSVLDGTFSDWTSACLVMGQGDESALSVDVYPVTQWQRSLVDIDEVDQARGDAARYVIDVRAPERYRGEVEPFDPVAGHIPGAINIFYKENLNADGHFKDPETLQAFYRQQLGQIGIGNAIVHCGSGVTACHTLLALEHAGLSGAALYVGSWSEWCRSGRT